MASMGQNLPSSYGSKADNNRVNHLPQQQLSSLLQLMWNLRWGVLQPLQESAGDDKIQMQQPSQRTSLISWQNTGSSPSHEEESIHQKADNEIIQMEIEVLRQHLAAKQLQQQHKDLLHQLAMT